MQQFLNHFLIILFKDNDGNEYTYNGLKWVGYDSPNSVKRKVIDNKEIIYYSFTKYQLIFISQNMI
jgi:hypothetical protein